MRLLVPGALLASAASAALVLLGLTRDRRYRGPERAGHRGPGEYPAAERDRCG